MLFEDDLSSGFAASYLAEEDEWKELYLELEIEEGFSIRVLKDMILSAIEEYKK